MTALRERAWDASGAWCGDGLDPVTGPPPLAVAHQCSGSLTCGTFICRWCERAVPWCFGSSGDDELSDLLCDDCTCERDDCTCECEGVEDPAMNEERLNEERPATCEACGERPTWRFWRGGGAWLCKRCDLPVGETITPERNAEWKRITAAAVAANRRVFAKEPLRVVAAAVLFVGKVYSMPPPARHHHVLMQIARELGIPSVRGEEQGFVLSDERFCRREPAWRIAEEAGQLLPRAPTDGQGHALYSEDVW